MPADSESVGLRAAAVLHQRARERDFWLVQAGVIGVTLVHTLLELRYAGTDASGLYEGLRHVPVVAYVVPVVFASLRYGLEGGLLTGALVTLLSLPSIVTAHRSGFDWAGELTTVVFVVAVGIVLSVVVENEQRSRARAEAVGRRLGLLDEIAASMSRLPDPRLFLIAVLDELVDALDLEAAGFVALDTTWPTLVRGPRPERLDCLRVESGRGARITAADGRSGTAVVGVGSGDAFGMLAVAGWGRRPVPERDLELVTSVAREMGVALENARLQESERRLRQRLLQEATVAQEEERKRIARELHDEAQTLVSLSRGLDRLAADGPAESAVIENTVGELRQLAVSGIDGLRRLSRDLRPSLLDDLGLVPALGWLVDRVAAHADFDAEFGVVGVPRRLDPEIELAAYRITQEALNNIQKHAEASTVAVAVEFHDDRVHVEIADDGLGFAENMATEGLSLGLAGMQERAELVGGGVAVMSRPGAGTVIALSIPR